MHLLEILKWIRFAMAALKLWSKIFGTKEEKDATSKELNNHDVIESD